MSLAAEKAAARAAAVERRKAAFAAGQGAASARLADLLAPFSGRALAGYMQMRTEIDPQSAMAAHAGPVCVPVVEAAGRPLRFRRWQPGSAMVAGRLGAPVPVQGDWLEPEVLIVPLLAWDRDGFRLGYGGGFYDRTLALLRAARVTVAVGFGFAAQEMANVPREPTDARLDLMVTEAEVLRFT